MLWKCYAMHHNTMSNQYEVRAINTGEKLYLDWTEVDTRVSNSLFVKILCLALGLAISSVIIAEIYFEQTYDTYFLFLTVLLRF